MKVKDTIRELFDYQGDEDRSKQYQYIAHNSQNYQNYKSLELGIVVKRDVLVFAVSFLLCCCYSPDVQQGCCPFLLSFDFESVTNKEPRKELFPSLCCIL